MERNLTLEEFAKIHVLGEKAEEVSKGAKEWGLHFLFEVTFGVFVASMVIKLESNDGCVRLAAFNTYNLFEDDNYERASKCLDEALSIVGGECRERMISAYEEKIHKLREGING